MARIVRLALVVLSALALLAIPVAAQAASHGHTTKHSAAKHKSTARSVPAGVILQCRSELVADAAAFAKKYADSHGGEALGRCIKQNLTAGGSDSTTPPADPSSNPAAACAAAKAAGPAAFQAKYADANGREAFGNCVRLSAQDPAAGDQGSGSSDQSDTPSDNSSPGDPASDDGSSLDGSTDDGPGDGVDYGTIFG